MSQKITKAKAINELKMIELSDTGDFEKDKNDATKIILKFLDDNKGKQVADAFRKITGVYWEI